MTEKSDSLTLDHSPVVLTVNESIGQKKKSTQT